MEKIQQKLGEDPLVELAAGLNGLEKEGLFAQEPGDRYFFQHDLVRNAAYSSLSNEDRKEPGPAG